MFTKCYFKLSRVDFKVLGPHLVSANIINYEDNEVIQETKPFKAASLVLKKISASLKSGTDTMFDVFLSILEHRGDLLCQELAKYIKELFRSTTGKLMPSYHGYHFIIVNVFFIIDVLDNVPSPDTEQLNYHDEQTTGYSLIILSNDT